MSHSDSRRSKTCNLQAYKLRALGNCSTSIRNFRTADLYGTKLVSRHVLIFSITHTINRALQGDLDHRTWKAKCHRTNRKEFVEWITRAPQPLTSRTLTFAVPFSTSTADMAFLPFSLCDIARPSPAPPSMLSPFLLLVSWRVRQCNNPNY